MESLYALPPDTLIVLPDKAHGNARTQRIFREAYARRRSGRIGNPDLDGPLRPNLWPSPVTPNSALFPGYKGKSPVYVKSPPTSKSTESYSTIAGYTYTSTTPTTKRSSVHSKRSSITQSKRNSTIQSKRSSIIHPKRSSIIQSKRTSVAAKRASFAPSIANQTHRVEIWQQATPLNHSFPHIRPPNKRRPRPRSIVRNKSLQFRKGLSSTFLSAYGAAIVAARAPFTSKSKKIKAKRRSVRVLRKPPPRISTPKIGHPGHAAVPHRIRPQPRPHSRPQEIRRTTIITTVEISGPLTSPTALKSPSSLSEVMSRRLFRNKSTKTVVPSPLSAHPPMLAHKSSFESDDKSSLGSIKSAATVQKRSPARNRDSFNKSKVNVRRPPKGISHWFEALEEDSSDDDYPEVVESPPVDVLSSPSSQPSITPNFQPSLGPNRSRGAPTSRVSGNGELSSDYFAYAKSSEQRNVLRLISEDPNDRSVLDLSSDEEGQSVPASPAEWELATPSPGLHSHNFAKRSLSGRIGSTTNRQSMASMQTTLTSATLPFMLRVSPVIDGDIPPLPTPTPDRHPASYYALTGRPPTSEGRLSKGTPVLGIRSQCGSLVSDSGAAVTMNDRRNGAAHMIAVTAEEMVLLDMMRRKRAAMQQVQQSPTPSSVYSCSIKEEDEPENRPPQAQSPDVSKDVKSSPRDASPAPSQQSRQHSLTSTITLESGENIEFPAPPAATASLPRPKSRQRANAPKMDFKDLPPPPTMSYWSPEIPTPGEEISELDAGPIPFRPAPLRTSGTNTTTTSSTITLTTPPRHRAAFRDSRTFSQESEASLVGIARRPPPAYNSTDPYQLMPDLNFSDLDLLPLGHDSEQASRSPSLTDGGSFSGHSRSELGTPIKETSSGVSAMGVDIVGSETGSMRRYGSKGSAYDEGARRELSVVEEAQSVGHGGRKPSQASLEVLNAWNALGGYTI